jgi:hypothetical protein
MHAAERETRRRPYALGLVILVHLLLAILFLSSPDSEREQRDAVLLSTTAARHTTRLSQTRATPLAPASSAEGPRGQPFNLSFDRVGLVGASSFPPPIKGRSASFRGPVHFGN